jgi:hypothetical protein
MRRLFGGDLVTYNLPRVWNQNIVMDKRNWLNWNYDGHIGWIETMRNYQLRELIFVYLPLLAPRIVFRSHNSDLRPGIWVAEAWPVLVRYVDEWTTQRRITLAPNSQLIWCLHTYIWESYCFTPPRHENWRWLILPPRKEGYLSLCIERVMDGWNISTVQKYSGWIQDKVQCPV